MDRVTPYPPPADGAATLRVAVIGAGIVGVSTAIWLQRLGHDVVLIDRTGPAAGTSFGNGGVLASASILPVTAPGLLRKAPRMALDPGQPLFVRWPYLPRMLPWLRRYLSHANAADNRRIASALYGIVGDSLADHQSLAAGTGAERWIVPSDYVFLYRDRAHFETDAFGWSVRAAHGFVWEEMDRDAFHAYDPVFGPSVGFGVRLGNHGRIADPGRYVHDLANYAVAGGATLLTGEVTDFVRKGGRLTGLRIADGAKRAETLACDAAVLATGIWSKALGAKLGLAVPMESERGYHVELWEPSAMPRSPVMVAGGKFVVTPMEGRIRVAGVVEFGGLDAPASRAPLDLLRRNIAATLPGLTWRKATDWMGHRPAPADSIPVIGPVPDVPGAYMAFGHHHVGLTGGPRTGRIIAQMVAGRPTNMDVAPYDPARLRSHQKTIGR